MNKVCADRKKLKPDDDNDAELFRRAAGRVRRLHDDRVRQTSTRPGHAAEERRNIRSPDKGPDPYVTETTSAHGPLFYASPGVQRRVMRQLKRGQIRIEEELDLHGMRVHEAGKSLENFLTQCRERGLRCVRVIHGKGIRTGGSVLKENVDRWLRLRGDVVAFCSAQPNDGGTGALYVLLKR